MTDVEELKHVLEVLNKFDLPVSPILEYAIKEKIEQLSSDDESTVVMPVVEVQENDGMLEVSVKTTAGTKKKPSVLRIIRTDGTIIECEKAAAAFCQAIKEVGVEKVYSLKIPMDNMHLVTIGGNPQYPTAQHNVGNGYFVNVHSNTFTKKRQLERIFKAFNLSWKVEIVESN
ncbi:MAG: hypothetical protein SPD44_13140 [Prevotella sp.]|nr:hypothetical protein [Prevotella sp.]